MISALAPGRIKSKVIPPGSEMLYELFVAAHTLAVKVSLGYIARYATLKSICWSETIETHIIYDYLP